MKEKIQNLIKNVAPTSEKNVLWLFFDDFEFLLALFFFFFFVDDKKGEILSAEKNSKS